MARILPCEIFKMFRKDVKAKAICTDSQLRLNATTYKI